MAGRGTLLFRVSAAGALLLHAWMLLRVEGIHGGADLQPHLRLMQLMAADPGLHSVYAPAYHLLGAWMEKWIGFAAFTRIFAFASAAALIGGFRSFQRAADLPDHASILFAWSPYLFALSWCTPKVEAAGYALAFWALARVLERRHALVGIALVGTFLIHTGAALFLGLCGGILALARRDWRVLAALTAGCAIATPLFAAHLAAGCSVAQTFMFSSGDYLRSGQQGFGVDLWLRVALLCSPVAVVAAVPGARALWDRNRPLAILCAGVFVIYLNQLWLAPFGIGTTLNLLRGLTVLAFATAICAGVTLALRPRLAPLVLGTCIVWAGASALYVVPDSCFVRSFSEAEIGGTTIDRCRFRWHKQRRAVDHVGVDAPNRARRKRP